MLYAKLCSTTLGQSRIGPQSRRTAAIRSILAHALSAYALFGASVQLSNPFNAARFWESPHCLGSFGHAPCHDTDMVSSSNAGWDASMELGSKA